MAHCPNSGASGSCERLVLVDCQFYRGSASHVRRNRISRPPGQPHPSHNFTALRLVLDADVAGEGIALPGHVSFARPVGDRTRGPGAAGRRRPCGRGGADLGWEETLVPSDPASPARSVVRREAVGVVAAVIPWNSPFSSAAAKIIPALLAGNSVVLKVSRRTR